MPRRFRFAALFALVLAVLPALAFAQGTRLRLSWDHCAAEGYVADRSFACNTNTGEDVLVASAVLGDEVPHATLAAFLGYLDFRATSPNLPIWWQVSAGMCRQNALNLQASGLIASPLCTPWYLADGTSTQEPLTVAQFEYYSDGANSSRIGFGAVVPAGFEITLPNGSQEFVFARLRILHSKTTGSVSCSGCQVPMCIGFGLLLLQYPGQIDNTYPIKGTTASTVTWQGAYASSYEPVGGYKMSGHTVPYHGNLGCASGPVPAQGRTWGMIKAFYR